MWTIPEECVERFHSLCDTLIDANRLAPHAADRASHSYQDLLRSKDFSNRAKDYMRLPAEERRLDSFFKDELAEHNDCAELYRIIKSVLIMSHGNSEVERGFSVNKSLLQDNQHERSLISQRLVHQAIPKTGKKFLEMDIDKQMMIDVRFSKQKYMAYLEDKRNEKTEEEKAADLKKRKNSEIKSLFAKKKKMSEDHNDALKKLEYQIEQLRK